MKRVAYIFVIIAVFALGANAQQLQQYSQYAINSYVLNPALSGINPYFEVKASNRYQWQGITDAPRTYILSVDGPYKTMKMGYGGYVFTDITGPTRRTGFSLSYAYHTKLTETIKLGLGLSGGILQFAVDGSKINMHDAGDLVLSNGFQTVVTPDFGFGFILHSEKWYFGGSVPQLYPAKLKFFDSMSNPQSKLAPHVFVNAGYKYAINEQFRLEPTLMIKYVSPVPVQFDLGAKVVYKDMVWLGVNFRTMDAVSVMVGYTFKNNLSFAYAYDITLSNLKRYTTGTHEIMLGLRFNNKTPLLQK